MNLDQLPIRAFALESCGAAAQALSVPITLTLQLPTAAQAISPGERPMGSVARIEVQADDSADDGGLPLPGPVIKPVLLTLTF